MRRHFATLALLAAAGASAETLWVGQFSAHDPSIPPPWRVERIDTRVPPTHYALRRWDGVDAIEAWAKKSMALLARPLEIDLRKTPILCWQWRIDTPVSTADMTRKSGDDYAARVYLSFELPTEQISLATRAQLALARTYYGQQLPDAALNYIWDNAHPIGTLQNNTYTERARMLVLRSGSRDAGRWMHERRHVLNDFQRAFGPLNGQLKALAVASDTDNTGEEAHAGFADFRFVSTEEECQNRSGGSL